jgi:dTDP-4-amino-4,6-dideoxygalactose transaminase
VLAAAIAAAQLKRLDELNAARQVNFERLHDRLAARVPFITWPSLAPGSTHGWYNTPAFYAYPPEKVSRDLFVEACAAEGVQVGPRYANWYQAPLFQDMDLFSQLWVVRHANGVEYKPLPAGALPHDEDVRRKLLLFPIPAVEAPALIDQMGAAVEKVAADMSHLAREQKKRSLQVRRFTG